ncbi:MAG: hypothetical protein QM784_23315 [Polyangiaceae bacterium]
MAFVPLEAQRLANAEGMRAPKTAASTAARPCVALGLVRPFVALGQCERPRPPRRPLRAHSPHLALLPSMMAFDEDADRRQVMMEIPWVLRVICV